MNTMNDTTKKTRGKNCAKYKWHFTGSICGDEINKKYSSLGCFLDEWGGEKTILNLNKYKLLRLKKKWRNGSKSPESRADPTDAFFAKHWRVNIDAIDETRPCKITRSVVYLE
jgi:hypothetical protein